MTTDELRDQIAEELRQHFPVNSAPGVVFCRCGTRVAADPDRLALRKHTADAILAVIEESSVPQRRVRLTRDHLAQVAEVYRRALSGGAGPTRAVANRFGVPHSTAAKWVARARQASLLGETTRGQAGEQR